MQELGPLEINSTLGGDRTANPGAGPFPCRLPYTLKRAASFREISSETTASRPPSASSSVDLNISTWLDPNSGAVLARQTTPRCCDSLLARLLQNVMQTVIAYAFADLIIASLY